MRPDPGFIAEFERRNIERLELCFQCGKCSNGCPLAAEMDLSPSRMVRAVRLGLRHELLSSAAIWLCVSCQTCTARCPNSIDIAGMIDAARQLSLAAGYAPAEPRIAAFHRAFLDSLRNKGRVHELELAARFKLAAFDPLGGARMGWELLRRGRLGRNPGQVRDRDGLRRLLRQDGE